MARKSMEVREAVPLFIQTEIFFASNQKEFDNWVRTIAIELIRQTPLDAVKYLDIFTLTPPVSPQKNEPLIKDCNHNCLFTPNVHEHVKKSQFYFHHVEDENRNSCTPKTSSIEIQIQPEVNKITISESNEQRNFVIASSIVTPTSTKTLIETTEDEQTVELLLKKCQNSDSYVPVKEKLKLFESLCRLGKINDDGTNNNAKYASKRTRSLHDLSHSENALPNNAGVKQICKYFETKSDANKNSESIKFNTIARIHRTSFGPVKTMIGRKYSVQSIIKH